HRLGDSVKRYHKYLDVEGGEFGGKRGQPLESALRVSPLNRNSLALDVAQLTQAVREGLELPREASCKTRRQKPDLGDLPHRLGHGGQRGGGKGEDDEESN